MSIGYAGTDFLEGIFRAMLGKAGTPDGAGIDVQAIYRRIAESENRMQATVRQVAGDLKSGSSTITPDDLASRNGDNVMLNYVGNADATVVSMYAEGILKDILRRSGHSSASITSTNRTPARQAQAMFQNLRRKGIASQRRLYGPYGDLVIDVYESANNAGKSDEQIMKEMTDRILAIGPEKVSRHLSDFNKLVVVDILPGSIKNHQAFREAVEIEKQNQRVSKAITNLVDDPAFHIEIPNREINAVLAGNQVIEAQNEYT